MLFLWMSCKYHIETACDMKSKKNHRVILLQWMRKLENFHPASVECGEIRKHEREIFSDTIRIY
jgi:hypothetical protein